MTPDAGSPADLSPTERLKRDVGRQAAARVESGMRLGLGTGSTVSWFLEAVARRLREGELADVVGVPTSVRTADRCHALGIELDELHELAPLDLAVDGADEIDPELNLVKGMGGALLREKIVAEQAERFLVIADGSKRVERLGQRSPLPVEVTPFAWRVHLPFLEELGARPELRRGEEGAPFTTDNGNYVLDCRFEGEIEEPGQIERAARSRTGIVTTGLFLGMATEALVADASGVRSLRPGDSGRSGGGP